MSLLLTLIFLLGWPFEWPAIVFIFVPMLAPVAKASATTWCGSAASSRSSCKPPSCRRRWRCRPTISSRSCENGILRLIYRGMADFMVIQVVCVILVLIFPAIAMWFPTWLQARRDAERKRVQIEQVVPRTVAAAPVVWK